MTVLTEAEKARIESMVRARIVEMISTSDLEGGMGEQTVTPEVTHLARFFSHKVCMEILGDMPVEDYLHFNMIGS